jgi:hypothetical protein
MKLIIEKIEDAAPQMIEEANGQKRLYIEGTFLQGAIKNRNGRVYPMEVLEPEVNRYVIEAVNANKGWGELTHPQGPQIDPRNVSHRIISLVKEGTNFRGKALVITENGPGAIVAGLINSGGSIGVSSRGMGSLKENMSGIMEVQKDFRIATAADVVLDPSAPDAFVRGVMEGVEWHLTEGNGWIAEKLDDTKKVISKMSLSQISEQKVDVFKSFMKNLILRNRN